MWNVLVSVEGSPAGPGVSRTLSPTGNYAVSSRAAQRSLIWCWSSRFSVSPYRATEKSDRLNAKARAFGPALEEWNGADVIWVGILARKFRAHDTNLATSLALYRMNWRLRRTGCRRPCNSNLLTVCSQQCSRSHNSSRVSR
jgi:hypothetical protein